MVKHYLNRKGSFIPFRRTKPGIGAEHLTTAARKSLTANRRLTQAGFASYSSGTLIHVTDPTFV